MLEKADVLAYKRDYAGAEKLIRQAINLDQQNAKVWKYLGDVYANKRDYKKSIEYLNKSAKLKPDYAGT